MVDILHELHKFVPAKSETKDVPVPNSTEVRSLKEIAFHRLLFGGDQLTAKRARVRIRIRNNSTNSADHLKGLLPVAEDWHTKLVFLEVYTMSCNYVLDIAPQELLIVIHFITFLPHAVTIIMLTLTNTNHHVHIIYIGDMETTI